MMGVSLTVLRDAMCLAESQRFMSYLTFLGRTWRGVDGDAETSRADKNRRMPNPAESTSGTCYVTM